jgi:flagellar basal-body rod protein FlgG
MIKALYTSATGLNAQQAVVDNTANNIANVNTNGFKKGQVDFQDLIYVTERPPGSEGAQGLQVPTGVQMGSGVRMAGITKVHNQGGLTNTGNQLDVAIEGDGFFQITLPNGETRYTRDGALRRNATGNLVTSDGFLLSPQVTIPQEATTISIGVDGSMQAIDPSKPNSPVSLGQLTLIRFPNPSGLSAEGRNLYAETPASGAAVVATPGLSGTGLLRQGFLERSNVDVVTELINLITAQRAYEFNTRAIRSADTMLGSSTEIVR